MSPAGQEAKNLAPAGGRRGGAKLTGSSTTRRDAASGRMLRGKGPSRMDEDAAKGQGLAAPWGTEARSYV